MKTVRDFYDFLDRKAPFSTQEDWDNSGLLAGSMSAEVHKAAVVLDITADAVREAVKIGADLIISHHPVIFSPLKALTADTVPYMLASSGISAICSHTPLDIAKGGTNDTLAELLGFTMTSEENSILRTGEIAETTAEKLASYIAGKLSAQVRYADGGKPIRKIAMCTGSGASLINDAGNIDAFITGDASHHDFIDAAAEGITLIAAGHYETEFPVVPVLAEELSKAFPDVETVDIHQKNTIKFI